MSLLCWLLTEHPFFVNTQQRLINILLKEGIASLDELVIRSRRPVRTVLLVLNDLVRTGKVKITTRGIISTTSLLGNVNRFPTSRLNWFPNKVLKDRASHYLDLETVKRREKPSLIWGQRRLIPGSAVDRASYILSQFEQYQGTIVFLGDDDLVSPLVAAEAPSWDVQVIDIDQTVLNQVERVSSELNAELSTFHSDLSQTSLGSQEICDIVVCDPFPSGDGSFEAMFWLHAVKMLRPDGMLITTVAPSHKPTAYTIGALNQLYELGFCPVDLQANFGLYEVFDFEFIPFEKQVLTTLGLHSSVSHTKSIITAKYVANTKPLSDQDRPYFDFEKWNKAAMKHYLTVQAGIHKQLKIANDRGIGEKYEVNQTVVPQRGLQVELILPSYTDKRDELTNLAVPSIENAKSVWTKILCDDLEIDVRKEELEELIRLSTASEINPEGSLAELGLAIRAIESWERWRFDD